MNKDFYFEYAEEFADYIVGEAENNEDLFLTVVGKYEEIKAILKEVMCEEFVNFDFLQIESPIVADYNDEFVLSLWMNDGILEIGCEKMKNEDGEYIDPCGDVVYLFGNCSSKIIPLCEESKLYFVDIEEECGYDECCEDCCPCKCCKDDAHVEYDRDEDGNIHGFTASGNDSDGYYICSYHTNDKLKVGDIHSVLKEFGF